MKKTIYLEAISKILYSELVIPALEPESRSEGFLRDRGSKSAMTIRFLRWSLVVMIGLSLTSWAQTHQEKISKELSFEKKAPHNTLMVFNINGDVKVEGYDGDKIVVEVEKIINGKTQARLEKGKAEIQLGVLDRADTLLLYVQGVCNEFGKVRKKGNWQSKWNNWGYNWNDCGRGNCNNGDNKEYDYEMNFFIKVPRAINLFTSTINGGDIAVTNINGYLLADNVNGSIGLKNISGATNASTVNGDVDLDYVSNPPGDSRYYSLNGDINANFKKGLSANLAFESFNGEFYTNVNRIESLPIAVEKKASGEGIKYKIGGSRYKVGNGGVLLDFETFNGNVYLKEKEN
jgi:hypothetical protein